MNKKSGKVTQNTPKSCRKNSVKPGSKNNSEPKWWTCPFQGCTYKTKYKGGPKRHMQTKHKNELELRKPFPCEICDYRTASRACLDRHVRRRHSLEKKKLPCPWCPSAFYWTQALQDHVLLFHRDERKLKCDHCQLFTFHHQRCVQTQVKKAENQKNGIIFCTIPNCSWCASASSLRATSNQQQKGQQLTSSSTAQPESQGTVSINCNKKNKSVETNSKKLTFQCQLCDSEGVGKQWASEHAATHKTNVIGLQKIS